MKRALRIIAMLLSMLILCGWGLLPRDPMVGTLLILCITLTLLQGGRLDRRIFWLFLIPILIAVVTVFRPGQLDMLSLVSRFVNLCASILLLNVYIHEEPEAFVRDICLLMRVFAIQAILTVMLALVAKDMFHSITSGPQPEFTLGYLFTYNSGSIGPLVRPNGPFFEPGVLQMFLNLYLYVVLFELKNQRQAVLATVAIMLCYSTTGVFLLAFIYAVYFFKTLSAKIPSRKSASLIILGGILVAVPLLTFVAFNVRNKLVGALAGSFLARYSDFFTGLNIIAAHPLVGIGFTGNAYFLAALENRDYSVALPARWLLMQGSTNGVLSQIYSLGIPLSLPFFIGMFRQGLFQSRIIIAAILLASLTTEKIFLCPFVIVVCFSGLVGSSYVKARKRVDEPSASIDNSIRLAPAEDVP